jgi:hypothetical protein
VARVLRCRVMQWDADQPTSYRRVTVKESAHILGISPEAVRARIKRGTLDKEKAEDGTVYVRLDADQPQWNADGTNDGTGAHPLIVTRLENEVEFLRRELERKDAILLNMTEAMKALNPPQEAPLEPRESDVSVSDGPGGDQVRPERERRSWWRRWFGL